MDVKGDGAMIGIMQGRLSPMVGDKIQCFPEKFWKAEFFIAEALGFSIIEWTLDRKNIADNPFFKSTPEVKHLLEISNIAVPSVTYDAAMQSPLVFDGVINDAEVELLIKVLDQACNLGLSLLVLPLVDQSSVTKQDYPAYVELLQKISTKFLSEEMKIAVESDFPPILLKNFIRDIGSSFVGVNYDVGNSSSLGYDFSERRWSLPGLIFSTFM